MAKERISAALDIMRRMPPSRIEQSLAGIINLSPDDTEELLQRVDQPLQEQVDEKEHKKYIICDYNRDGDSYRSPWSNKYDPPLEDGLTPVENLRKLEVEANDVFALYAQSYYTNATTSVYFWSLDGDAFASCWLVKKEIPSGGRYVSSGSWDSMHVIEARPATNAKRFNYKITTTCMVGLAVSNSKLGNCNLSGSIMREGRAAGVIDPTEGKTHISHMGQLLEKMENQLREHMEAVYIGKTHAITSTLHKYGDGQKKKLTGMAT